MPEATRIIETISVQENPRIVQSGNTTLDPFTIQERTEETNRYWNSIDQAHQRRRFFPIEYQQLDQLSQATGKAALLVHNINNPSEVNAQWISFDAANPPTLAITSYCFVLSEPYYSSEIALLNLESVTHAIRGIKTVKAEGALSNFLVAMLGQTSTGEYVLYVQNASADLIELDPGATFDTAPGGEGSGGVKLPRKPK